MIKERSKLPWIKTKTVEQQAVKVNEIVDLNEVIVSTAKKNGHMCIAGNNASTFKEVLEFLNLK